MARLSRLLLVGVLAAVIAPIHGQSPASGKPSIMNGEWPDYSGDLRGWRYSPLDQINASNFNQLQVAWRFKTDSLGPRPEYKLEGTPVMVKGTLYTTGGTRRSVISLDGRTGELNWAHSLREGQRAAVSPRQLSGAACRTGPTAKATNASSTSRPGYQLVELDAKTGAMIQSFANKGVLDLKVGVVKGVNQQIDLESRRDRHSLDARPSSATSSSSVRPSVRAPRSRRTTTRKASCARSTCGQANSSGASTRFRIPASSATRRGKTIRGRSTATSASGHKSAWTKSSDSSTCPSSHRPPITTAVTGRGTTCLPKASCAST